MNLFQRTQSFSLDFLRFANAVQPEAEEHPFEIPVNVGIAHTSTDPATGVQVMVVLKDGKWRFYMHTVESLKRLPRVPHEDLSLA